MNVYIDNYKNIVTEDIKIYGVNDSFKMMIFVYYHNYSALFWRSSTFTFSQIRKTFALETYLQFSSPFTWSVKVVL